VHATTNQDLTKNSPRTACDVYVQSDAVHATTNQDLTKNSPRRACNVNVQSEAVHATTIQDLTKSCSVDRSIGRLIHFCITVYFYIYLCIVHYMCRIDFIYLYIYIYAPVEQYLLSCCSLSRSARSRHDSSLNILYSIYFWRASGADEYGYTQ
jgi:hypothetical protein